MTHKIKISSNEPKDKKLIEEIKAFYSTEQYEVCKLDVGDIVCGQTCIELKTAEDFFASLKTEEGATIPRILRQAQDMQQFERPRIIISATIPELIFESRKFDSEHHWNIESLIGYIASIEERFNVPIKTFGKVGLAYYIKSILNKSNDGKIPILNPLKAHATSSQEQEAMLCSIRNMGPKTAISLLIHFKTVQYVINASIDQLCEVNGIGPKTATQIYEIVRREYKT